MSDLVGTPEDRFSHKEAHIMLHPPDFLQERIAKSHGSQCGFCTPGIVMSMYTLLRNNPLPTAQCMEKAFEGTVILDSVHP